MNPEPNDHLKVPLLGQVHEHEDDDLDDDLKDLLHRLSNDDKFFNDMAELYSEDFNINQYLNFDDTPEPGALVEPIRFDGDTKEFHAAIIELCANEKRYPVSFEVTSFDPQALQFRPPFADGDGNPVNDELPLPVILEEVKEGEVTPEESPEVEDSNRNSGDDSGKGTNTGASTESESPNPHSEGSSTSGTNAPADADTGHESDFDFNEDMNVASSKVGVGGPLNFFVLPESYEYKSKECKRTVKKLKGRTKERTCTKQTVKRTPVQKRVRRGRNAKLRKPAVAANPTKRDLLKLATLPAQECFDPSKKLGPRQLRLIQPLDKNSGIAKLYAARACKRVERHRRFRLRRRIRRNQLAYHAAHLEHLNEILRQKMRRVSGERE